MGSYWFSVLRVLFWLPLFFVLCPLLNASLLVFGVVCFALFAFVLCLVSTVDCVFIGCRCCVFRFVCLCSLSCVHCCVLCFVCLCSLSCAHCCLCLYWSSVLCVLFCLPLFSVLCPLLLVSLLVVGVVCFVLFAFVLCLVSTVVCFVLFAFVLCLVSTVVCFVLFAFVLCIVSTVACVDALSAV